MKSKQGFVLISVLLITTITSMVAFSAIAENRLQEQVAGNHKKELNARLQAEKGIFEGYNYIKEQHNLKQPPAEILGNIAQQVTQTTSSGNIEILDPLVLADGTFSFVSKGSYQGAVAYLKATIKAHQLKGESGFPDTIVGCEGVQLTGSGTIDSYDSRNGLYKATYQENGLDVVNQNNKANVATLGIKNTNSAGEVSFQGADVTLSGDAPVLGDVNATGNFFSSGSAHVDGNLNANGNVGFQGKNVSSGTSDHIITGNIASGGDVSMNSNTVAGNIAVAGNASDTQNVNGTVSYGDLGSISGESNLTAHDSRITGPNLAMSDCDTRSLLPTMINNGEAIDEPLISGSMKKQLSGLDAITTLLFQTTTTPEFETEVKQAQVLAANTTDGTEETLYTEQMFVLGEEKPRDVFVFESFHLRSRFITIKGDVTFVIKGDFETSGDGSGFQFEAGDTKSSLTIITEGSVKIGSDSQMFTNARAIDGNVPLSIYSSYDSAANNKEAVILAGKTDAYARVYAPKGNVIATNSGHVMGAIHAKKVEVSGAGGVHYDEALLDIEDIKNTQEGLVQFLSVYYHYN